VVTPVGLVSQRPGGESESELGVEIARSQSEIQTRIDGLIGRDRLSETEIDALQEIDRLLYDVVLDLRRLQARDPRIVRPAASDPR
jgi:hypothetical protein